MSSRTYFGLKNHAPVARLGGLLCVSVTALAGQALAATLTLGDDLISAAECSDRTSKSMSLSWDFSGATSGTEYAIVASTDSGCPASSSDSGITTHVVVDGITASSTSQSNSDLTLADLLSAAGVTSPSCTGDDTQIYVCVRLLDSSGSTLSTASARLKLQVASPPPPSDVSVAPGESALTVSWSPGTATTATPASSKTYRVFATAGGRTVQSDETSNTSLRLSGLEIGTTYDVTVMAYSQAGNASAASDPVPGTPVNVTDFWESYQAAGGRDGGGGGCAHAGMDPSALSLLVVALLLWRRRRRPRQRLGEPTRANRAALLLFLPALLVDRARADSPHLGSLELRLSGYRPRIDSEFAGAASPYADAFGSGRGWMGRGHLSGEVARLAGALEVGAGVGYFERYGHGRLEDGSGSADTTALKIVPLSLAVTYRWEDAFDRFGVPAGPLRAAIAGALPVVGPERRWRNLPGRRPPGLWRDTWLQRHARPRISARRGRRRERAADGSELGPQPPLRLRGRDAEFHQRLRLPPELGSLRRRLYLSWRAAARVLTVTVPNRLFIRA